MCPFCFLCVLHPWTGVRFSMLAGDLMSPNETHCLRAGSSPPGVLPVTRTRLSLSDSQLANEILDDFQAIVNYVLFQNLSSLRSSRMPFLYLGSHLLCLYARLTLFTVVFRGIETQRCTEANCTSHSICSKVLKRQ